MLIKHLRSFIVCFSVFFFHSVLDAQNTNDTDTTIDAAHQFFWFHGHWNPANKKQFIIDKDSNSVPGSGAVSGGTVTLRADGSMQLNTGSANDWNKKIDEALKKIDDWETKLENPASADVATFDLSKILLADVKEDKHQYENYKIDPKQDVLNPAKEQQAKNNINKDVAAYCQKIKPTYDAIMDFWDAHKKDKDPDLHIPPPPEFEYNCYACDSSVRKTYDTTIEHYVRDFFHPEDSLINQGFSILREFYFMGLGPEGQGASGPFENIPDLFHKDKKDLSKSGLCSYLDLYKLSDVVHKIANHAYRRSQELVRRYKNDFKAATAIINTSCSGASGWASLGGQVNDDDLFAELSTLIQKNFEFYYNKLSQHDWKQIANIPYMFTLIRDYALFLGQPESSDFKDLMKKVSQVLNNFHLNIEMDIKIGKDGGYELCHLKGETKIAPDFVQTENQCYRWVVVEDQPTEITDDLKVPVKKSSQKIDVDLLTNEIIAPSPLIPKYIGTKKYYSLLKNLKMDFCNPGNDSILLTSFIPSPDANAGIWKIPNAPQILTLGIMGMDHFFQDASKMQQEAKSGQAKTEAEDMKRNAEEMKAKMEALASQMGNGKSKTDLNKYIELQKMATQMQDKSNNKTISPIFSIGFQLPVDNNDTIVNKKFDAKEVNPREAETVVYGYYTVKVIYKPDNK